MQGKAWLSRLGHSVRHDYRSCSIVCNVNCRFCCRLFSIDPPTARDLDDALSVESLPEGNFRVGVHIADVAHFVRYIHDMLFYHISLEQARTWLVPC